MPQHPARHRSHNHRPKPLGQREEIIPQDGAGFGFVTKAHPAAHIEIRVGGRNAVDGPKDKQDVE